MKNQINLLIHFLSELGSSLEKNTFQILSNNKKDIKLSTDIEINKKIISFLENNFEYPIISEENNNNISFTNYNGLYWIIDPLDGSMNYSRNIPISCISISLWEDHNPNFGLIYDFNNNNIYLTRKAKCYVNNRICKTSTESNINNAILCTGFPSYSNINDDNLKKIVIKIQHWKKIRAIGSAAMSLAWVARGWVDAYIEEDIRIWDVAAGLALVQAAGGKIFIKENDRSNFVTAIATNGKISLGELK